MHILHKNFYFTTSQHSSQLVVLYLLYFDEGKIAHTPDV